MKYLKVAHNYTSLKMKYKQKQEKEFPTLGKKKTEIDGFVHMVEEEEPFDDESTNSDDKQEELNILKVNPDDFIYDDKNDTIVPKSLDDFDNLVEKHPSVNKLKRDNKREEKVAKLKGKVLDTLKVRERRKEISVVKVSTAGPLIGAQLVTGK